MVRFIETIKFDPAFAKAIYDAFYDAEKQTLDFQGRRFKYAKAWKGWPDGLDLENFEIVGISSEEIVFESGGDWQEMIPVSLCLNKSNKLSWKPFEPYTCIKKSYTEIKCAIQDLINCVKEMDEDTQIAGTMLGELPPNVGSTLSLGYKSGRILPAPNK